MHYYPDPDPYLSPDTNGHTIPTDAPVSEHGPALDHDPEAGVLPVSLPPGFPAAPAEACATLVICGHEIEIVLRDVDEARLLARMTGLLEAWDEGDEEDGEEDVN